MAGATDAVDKLTSNSSASGVFMWIGRHIWFVWIAILALFLAGKISFIPAVCLCIMVALLRGGMSAKAGAVKLFDLIKGVFHH